MKAVNHMAYRILIIREVLASIQLQMALLLLCFLGDYNLALAKRFIYYLFSLAAQSAFWEEF
jgi:hypothetical protein